MPRLSKPALNRCSAVRLAAAAAPLVFGLLLAGPAPAGAQQLSVGPRAGLNVSGILFQETRVFEQTQPRFGGHLGAAVVLDVNRFIDLEGALLYGQGGYRGEGGLPADLRTDDLVVPVTARLRLPWSVSPHVAAGVAARYQLRCRLTDVVIVGETSCDDPVIGTEWRRLEMLGLAGVGVDVPLAAGTVRVDALLAVGLGDVKRSTLPPGWARSLGFRLSTAYLIPWRQL